MEGLARVLPYLSGEWGGRVLERSTEEMNAAANHSWLLMGSVQRSCLLYNLSRGEDRRMDG